MADTKISALTDGVTAVASDKIPVERAGANRYVTPSYIVTYALGLANTWTAANTFSANGAVSASAFKVTGTPFTGGSATTTKPLAMVETSGATSTAWSTSGTMLGINAPSGFGGRVLDVQSNGVSEFSISSFSIVTRASISLTTTGASITFTGSGNAILTAPAAATWQYGAAAAASPVAQTVQSQGSRSGTDTNVGGGNLTIQSGNGTGTGTLSTLILRSPVAVGSGTGAQTQTTSLTLRNGTPVLPSYAAASLPSASTSGAGATVYVSDEAKHAYSDGTNWRRLATEAPQSNILINGDFAINQRVFAGGALSAGVYGFDRWKADTGGCNVSVSSGTVTLTSGTVMQVVEPTVWNEPNLASTAITVSVEALTGGNLTVNVGSSSGTITAGTGRRSVTITTGAGDTGNINVKLAPASVAVTFKKVKAEIGNIATGWLRRSLVEELQLCQRYYAKSFDLGVAPQDAFGNPQYPGFSWSTTSVDAQKIMLPVPMRNSPTVTTYSTSIGGGAGIWAWHLPGTGWAASSATAISEVTTKFFNVRMTVVGATSESAYIVSGSWAADAEL